MILYSNDDENYLNFIQFLSNFLQEYCCCEVNAHELKRTETNSSETNVKRIQGFIDLSDITIFFLSRKVCLRYLDILRCVINPPTSSESYESLAVVSDILKLSMSTDSISKKCYQILFVPSAKSELALNELVKECYRLPDEIRCFLKTTCGISKISRKQKTALGTLESSLIRQPLLRSLVSEDMSHESIEFSTINNNRFSSKDLNREDNNSAVYEVEGDRLPSETSGDSAYYSGAVHEYLQLQVKSNDTVPFTSTVSLVRDNVGQGTYSEYYEIESKSFLAPSSVRTSCEDVEHNVD